MPSINMVNEITIDNYREKLFGLEQSKTDCPTCRAKLYIYPEGTSPDDYDNALVCALCFYYERD